MGEKNFISYDHKQYLPVKNADMLWSTEGLLKDLLLAHISIAIYSKWQEWPS